MRFIQYLLVSLIILGAVLGCSTAEKDKDVLYQTSTINALLNGVYDGEVTFQELKEHGNFGLGTVDALDGEMIALDGKFYQIKTDGKAYSIEDSLILLMISDMSAMTFTASSVFVCAPSILLAMSSAAWAL